MLRIETRDKLVTMWLMNRINNLLEPYGLYFSLREEGDDFVVYCLVKAEGRRGNPTDSK